MLKCSNILMFLFPKWNWWKELKNLSYTELESATLSSISISRWRKGKSGNHLKIHWRLSMILKTSRKSVWSNTFWYVKVYIFSIFDSVSFLIKFVFFSAKSMDYLTLKRHNSIQNKINRKATPRFAPRPLIFKLPFYNLFIILITIYIFNWTKELLLKEQRCKFKIDE